MMKVALVTGASKGIGKACALRLARDGYTVVVNYSSSDEAANATLDQIKAEGGDGMIYKADVSKLDEVKVMVREVFKAYGRIGQDVQAEVRRDYQHELRVFEVCPRGPGCLQCHEGCREFPDADAREGTRRFRYPRECGGSGLYRNGNDRGHSRRNPQGLSRKDSAQLKRFGSADEVANIVSALASDQFAYVTGQVFVLDGGLSL